MSRQQGPKPQAPKRPHLGIKREVSRRKKIALASEKRKRERG